MLATQSLSREEQKLLTGLPMFAGISQRELAQLAAGVRRRSYKRGEVIHRVDDLAGDVFVVVAGHVKHRLVAADGRQLTHAVQSAGEFFGILSVLDGKRRAGDAVALTDCEVLVIDRDVIAAFRGAHSEANSVLLDFQVIRLRSTLALVHDLAFLSVPLRLAKTLLQFAQPPGSPQGIDVLIVPPYLNQTELAHLVGTTRESVNQWLKRFARQGWLELGRRSISIVDAEALRSTLD